MKRTYERTMTVEDLTKAKFVLDVYNVNKYRYKGCGAIDIETKEIVYTNVKSFSIIDGDDAKEIEAESDASCIDECHEYLVLEFADGTTLTFRNSYVDMFIH